MVVCVSCNLEAQLNLLVDYFIWLAVNIVLLGLVYCFGVGSFHERPQISVSVAKCFT